MTLVSDRRCGSHGRERKIIQLRRPWPSGSDWLHEIKHDGARILAPRDAAGVRLITCNDHKAAFL